jgi:glycosyltransferase involved in cell wall biosynthesis
MVNPRARHAPNATDFESLSKAAETSLPESPELRGIPAPRLGYIGQIGENIDYGMVRAVAAAHPEWSLVFVGPVWATRQAEVDALAALPNVRFLGGRPHAQLSAFLRGFDVCVMPHLCNALTLSMDPTKLYDYLASGRPIVSTRVAGTERFAEVVRFGDTPEDFVREVESALCENGSQAPARLALARQNSWPVRAREMWAVIG